MDHSDCPNDPLSRCHWRPIPIHEFHGFYDIGCTGRIYSHRRGREMRPAAQWNGYIGIVLSRNKKIKRFTMHRLVAMAFLPNPTGLPEVDHLDNDRTNNSACNLEWVTISENQKRAIRRGAPSPPRNDVRGERNGAAKLTEAQARWILTHPKKYGVGKRLADQLGVSPAAVQSILRGDRWAHLRE